MKKIALAAGACLVGLIPLTLATTAQEAAADAEPTRIVVGTFDSRGIAIAYANSELFEEEMVELREKHDRAKRHGEEELLAELEAAGKARQAKFHRQAFCAAPVDDILVHLEERLPALAREAGVDLLVSQWDVVFQDSEVQLVDVTDLLVNEFEPEEKVLKWIADLEGQDPLPLEELKDCDH